MNGSSSLSLLQEAPAWPDVARWSSLLPAGAQMMQPGPTSGFLQGSGFPSEDPHYRPKEETTYEKTRTTIGRPAGSPLKIP